MPRRTKVRIQKRPRTKALAKQKRELVAIAALPDNEIDTSETRLLPLETWKNAIRGRFYRADSPVQNQPNIPRSIRMSVRSSEAPPG